MELSYPITVTPHENLTFVGHLFTFVRFTGGRQVDGAIPSLLALENIMKSPEVKNAVKSGNFTVLFDSGIRRGPDIIKAIALGAQAVLCKCLQNPFSQS